MTKLVNLSESSLSTQDKMLPLTGSFLFSCITLCDAFNNSFIRSGKTPNLLSALNNSSYNYYKTIHSALSTHLSCSTV